MMTSLLWRHLYLEHSQCSILPSSFLLQFASVKLHCELQESEQIQQADMFRRSVSFLPRDATSAAYAVMRCLCVCLSVTFVDHVNTNKRMFKIFSPSGSPIILVFPYQTGWWYSDGNPHNGGVECRWGKQKNAILGEYMASLHTGLQCCQPYESRSVKNKAATNGGKRRALTAASVVRCSHKRTTKCLLRARRYTPETKGGQTPFGHNPRFLLP